MSKTIFLHLFITLLILDWSYAFTSSLTEHQVHGHHNPETHHSAKRHASRRNNRYLNEEEKTGPSSTAHRQVRRESTGSMVQDNIQDIFNIEENPGADRQIVKRQSSAPVFHQNNAVPGSSINNHFHQYPTAPVYQQPQPFQQSQPVQQSQQLQLPVPFYPYGFGGSKPTIGTATRVDSDDDGTNEVNGNPNTNDYRPLYVPNTPTGISLDRVPPRRNDSRRPPPIAHGPESNSIIPPNNIPQQQTSRPIFQIPTTARPVNQRPSNQNNRPNNQRPVPRPTQRPVPRPTVQRPSNQGSQGSSNSQGRVERTSCAFAILQCCRGNEADLRCFSTRECPGPFFDNPCDSDLAREVSKFVNSDNVLFFN